LKHGSRSFAYSRATRRMQALSGINENIFSIEEAKKVIKLINPPEISRIIAGSSSAGHNS
jgi:hypothetical protein